MQLELRDCIFSKSREQGLITKEGIVLIVYSPYMENTLSIHTLLTKILTTL